MQKADLFDVIINSVASYCAATDSSLDYHYGFAIEISNTKQGQDEQNLARSPGSETS